MTVRRAAEMRRRPALWNLAVIGLFAMLSAATTWPLVLRPGSILLGPPAPGDNFYYAYNFWWFRHALLDLGVSPFFNPNLFHPFGYNILSSAETTLSNVALSWPVNVLCGQIMAYSVVVLSSFVLAGLGTYLLVLYLTGNRKAGIIAGATFAFCPQLVTNAAGTLPLVGIQWLPFLFLFLEMALQERRSRFAALAGLFYALASLSSWYYAYMMALFVVVYLLWRARPWREYFLDRRLQRCALAFVALPLLLVGPCAISVARAWEGGARPHSFHYLDSRSASLLGFFLPSMLHPIWGEQVIRFHQEHEMQIGSVLYLGVVPLLLAALAIWRRRHRMVGTFAALGALSLILALGMTLHWTGKPVYVPVPSWVERVFTVGMSVISKRLALNQMSTYDLRVENAIYIPMPTLFLYLSCRSSG